MYEFYVNEEWLGIARVPLDTLHEGYAVLKKYRIDSDDEHVVVRRKADDVALRAELAARDVEIARLREELVTALCQVSTLEAALDGGKEGA